MSLVSMPLGVTPWVGLPPNILIERVFSGGRSPAPGANRIPFGHGVTAHCAATPFCMTGAPDEISHKGQKEKSNNKNVHKSTIEQSDTQI